MGYTDGNTINTYYINNQNDSRLLINLFLTDILDIKYKGYTIYFHNGSKFDLNFILNEIGNHYETKIVGKRDMNILSILILNKRGSKIKLNINIYDSYLLLPASLDKLSIAFNIGESKFKYFPYNIINGANLHSVIPRPTEAIYYAPNTNPIELSEYLSTTDSNMCIKSDTITYLKSDINILYQIISKYSLYIFNTYKSNITDSKTLSSLAFNIYRSNYLPRVYKRNNNLKICIMNSKYESEIRAAYYGGESNVYRPKSDLIYAYDINSAYPYVMRYNYYPVGKAVYTNRKNINDIFGFINVNIEAREDMYLPVLPYRHPIYGMICPVGKWTGTYFSEELKSLNTNDYKITVNYSIEYNSRNDLFNEYIDHFYSLKMNSTDGTNRLNSKLMLNSLYGRFGLNIDNIATTALITNNQWEGLDSIKDNYIEIINNIELIDNILLYYKINNNEFKSDPINNLLVLLASDKGNIINSTPIAAAISAYARIYINKYKLMYKDNIYYTDTDSLYLSVKMNNSDISNTILGKWKYEGEYNKAIFIAPKLYYLGDSNREIIKNKGVSNNLSYNQFINLYKGISQQSNKIIFKKDIANSTVNINNTIVNISGDLNKRIKLYDDNNNWYDTKPIVLK